MDLYRKHVQLEIYRQVLYVMHEKGLNYFSEDIPNCLFLTTIIFFKKKRKKVIQIIQFLKNITYVHTHTKWKGKITGMKFSKDLFPRD